MSKGGKTGIKKGGPGGRRRRPNVPPTVAKPAARKLDPQMIADNVEQVSSLLRMTSDPKMVPILISLSHGGLDAEALTRAVDQDQAEVHRRLATLRRAGLIAEEGERARVIYSPTEKGLDVAHFLEDMIAREDRSDVEIDPALLESLGEVLEDPEAWLRTPNTVFGGRKPLDLLGTPEEPILRNRILAATLGMFS